MRADRVCLATLGYLSVSIDGALADMTWHGRSNSGGGEVVFDYNVSPDDPAFDPEQAESGELRIRCDGFDGRLTISFMGDHDASGDEAKKAIFAIGLDRFERMGILGYDGLYPATPVIETSKSDPLIHALILGSDGESGATVDIHVGRVGEISSFSAPLSGAKSLFMEHLRACL